ncbi:hypothetical protein RB195_013327 [Necator americanus]|uniref:Secreted protein n=1 Tax=Necator americanus TaxID=51031 RepID=A0ABR1DV21_NECAM
MKRLACTAIGFDAHLSFLACLQSLAWSARLVNVADAPHVRMVHSQTWVSSELQECYADDLFRLIFSKSMKRCFRCTVRNRSINMQYRFRVLIGALDGQILINTATSLAYHVT